MGLRKDNKGHLISYCEMYGNNLRVYGRCSDGMDKILEEFLERRNAKIECIRWQSIYNNCIEYEFEPYDHDVFLCVFVVSGEKPFLEWLEKEVELFLYKKESLEKSFVMDAYIPAIRLTFKIGDDNENNS